VPLDFPDSSVFPFVRFWEKIEKNVRKVVDPIQNSFATFQLLLQLQPTRSLFPYGRGLCTLREYRPFYPR
jgi:hypothetical protein